MTSGFALLLVLAQAATARPSPSPPPRLTPLPTSAPGPAATAIPRTQGANSGLAGAASRVKLNRAVRFDDLDQGKAAATPVSAPQTQTCDTKSFKLEIDGIVSRFQAESRTADRTPRSALAAQISRLHTIRAEVSGLGPKAPPCATEVVPLADAWMGLEIADLDAFLGKSAPSYKRGQLIDKAWRDYESARLLLP